MQLNQVRNLLLIAPLLTAVVACSKQTCDNTPFCLNPPHAEVEPFGHLSTPGAVVLVTPGQSQEVEVTIDRSELPAGDPVYFLPGFDPPPSRAPSNVLASTADGITVTGSRELFTSETAMIHVNTPATLPHGGYEVYSQVRRVQ